MKVPYLFGKIYAPLQYKAYISYSITVRILCDRRVYLPANFMQRRRLRQLQPGVWFGPGTATTGL